MNNSTSRDINLIDGLHFFSSEFYFDVRLIHELLNNGVATPMSFEVLSSIMDDGIELPRFGNVNSLARDLFFGVNKDIFKNRNIHVLDGLTKNISNLKTEKKIKFLTLIMLSQEFIGINIINNHYTKFDFRNIIEGSNSGNQKFMAFHLIHYLNHKWSNLENIFSLYLNSDLDDDNKIDDTINFSREISESINKIFNSNYFDDCFIPLYQEYSQLKNISNNDLMRKINYSSGLGSIGINPIVIKLENLKFGEFYE